MKAGLRRFLHNEEGAALLEYGMIVMLIALLCIVAVKSLGSKLNNGLESANTQLP
jgi:pilus assembly protein Flp/PilA